MLPTGYFLLCRKQIFHNVGICQEWIYWYGPFGVPGRLGPVQSYCIRCKVPLVTIICLTTGTLLDVSVWLKQNSGLLHISPQQQRSGQHKVRHLLNNELNWKEAPPSLATVFQIVAKTLRLPDSQNWSQFGLTRNCCTYFCSSKTSPKSYLNLWGRTFCDILVKFCAITDNLLCNRQRPTNINMCNEKWRKGALLPLFIIYFISIFILLNFLFMNWYLFLLEMHDHKFANKLIQCILVSIQANIYRIRNGLFFLLY